MGMGDPGRYILLIFPLYSWGSLFWGPQQSPFELVLKGSWGLTEFYAVGGNCPRTSKFTNPPSGPSRRRDPQATSRIQGLSRPKP